MSLLVRMRDRWHRNRIPTELFVPAPAFPAYSPVPLTPDFLPVGVSAGPHDRPRRWVTQDHEQ